MNSNLNDPTGTPRNETSAAPESQTVKPAAGNREPEPPAPRHWSWMLLLRLLLVLDGLLLFALGALFIFAPSQVQQAFHFNDLPAGVGYIIGLWGCVLLTMGLGYLVAATNPLRHLVWVQVAILRGLLEFALGVVYLVRGLVTLPQAIFGIVVAALMTIAYLALYPRPRRDIRAVGSPVKASV